MKDTGLVLATIYNRIASSYQRMKKYNEAYDYFGKGLTVAKKYNDTAIIVLLSSHIARALIAAEPAASGVVGFKTCKAALHLH